MLTDLKIFRNRKKTRNILLTTAGICIAMALICVYGLGVFDNIFKAKVTVVSGALFLLLFFLMIKSLLNLKDKSAFIELTPDYAKGKTAPLPKSIGEIYWKDVTAIDMAKIGGDTLVIVFLNNPEFYRSKLSKMFFDMAYDKELQELQVSYSASEIDMRITELYDLFISYWEAYKKSV